MIKFKSNLQQMNARLYLFQRNKIHKQERGIKKEKYNNLTFLLP